MEEQTKKNLYKAGSKLASGSAVVLDAAGSLLHMLGSASGKALKGLSNKLDEKTKDPEDGPSVHSDS